MRSKRYNPLTRIAALLGFGVAAFGVPTGLADEATNPSQAYLVNLEGTSRETKLAASAVAGIANRKKPAVFLDAGQDPRWNRFDFGVSRGSRTPIWGDKGTAHLGKDYRAISNYWIDYFSQEGLFSFQQIELKELLSKLESELKGIIVYDDFESELCIAATAAGLMDAIPLSRSQYNSWKEEINLPVVLDLADVRKAFDPQKTPRLEAHQWAIDNLLPKCGKDGALSRWRGYNLDENDTLHCADLAIKNRWFVYDLNHIRKDLYLEMGIQMPVSSEVHDTEYLDQILSTLQPFSMVYGWGKPDEDRFVRRLAVHALIGQCSGDFNMSFFQQWKSDKPFKQKQRTGITPETVELENKIYIACISNEGDSIKAAMSLMCFGSWIQPERGTIPLNWGVDPALFESFSGLMSYYYTTATPNDYFFAATSGWGYTHPSFLPKDSYGAYASLIRKGAALADVSYIDIWWLSLMNEHMLPFLSQTGMKGLTQWSDYQGVEFTPDGFPIVYSNLFYLLDDPKEFAKTLIRNTAEISPPWFIAVYGAKHHATPHKFAEFAKELPKEKFKLVTLDEFFSAAVKARPQIEGKKWYPPKDSPVGVAP